MSCNTHGRTGLHLYFTLTYSNQLLKDYIWKTPKDYHTNKLIQMVRRIDRGDAGNNNSRPTFGHKHEKWSEFFNV